ncbi:MAG TPA: thioesterase family protein [Thermodesulfobacteriota bacterium]|nr:thioesterase family protein [Thermodesulfobacteriota bacterium]
MKFNASDYPHSFKRQVFLYETDAFGHANNVTFFQYMESARFELMKELRLFDPSDILSCNFILAHAECDYRQISRYNDILVIYSRISQIKTSSFVIEHLMINEKTGNLAATGKVVLVSFNHKKNRTEPLSQKVKKALKSYMGAVKKRGT